MLISSSLQISPQEQRLINSLDDKKAEMVKTVMEWSSQNSGSRNRDGLKAMRAMLKDVFSQLPGRLEDVTLASSEYVSPKGEKIDVDYEPSLQVTVRPEAPIQIVLTGHYDTVFPKDFHFQTPIFLDDDTINGPGTADMKAGLLVMFHALNVLEHSDLAKNVGYTVLMSPDEEIGSPGSAPILTDLGKKSHLGLTYEPALPDGSLAGARKGSGNFAVIIKGRAAHAGREHHIGRNAIAALATFITKLDALNGQRDGVTFNIAKVDGGGASNIVPELAIGRFNVRVQEETDVPWVLKEFNTLIESLNGKDGITAEMTGGFTRPPKPMAPANATIFEWVRQAGLLLGHNIQWAPSGGVCEGNNLWASGCPNVDTLGVIGGHIHSDQEFMKVSSLVERAKLSALILLKIASGEFDAQSVKKQALENIATKDTLC